MLRPLARRLRRSNEPVRSSAAASEQLRQQVLSSVRGSPMPGARASARGHGWVIAGTALVVALAASATVALVQSSPTPGPAPSAKVRVRPTVTQAALRRIGSGAELAVAGMPEPPVGEVYEVWLANASGRPRPTDALFTVTSAGEGSVAVPGPLRGVREVIVTSEPLGGSSVPTSAPVLRLSINR